MLNVTPETWRRRLSPVLLPNLGGPSLTFRAHRIEFAMAQSRTRSHTLATDPDNDVTLFPTRHVPGIPAELPAPSAGRPARGQQVPARAQNIRQVTVLEVAGRLGNVVQDLDHEIQVALAEGPRGVVCDLSSVLHEAEPAAVDMLATAGRHVRDWSGMPIAVACPDPRVRDALRAHPLGGHLIAAESMFSAVSAVLATTTMDVESLHLAAHPTAPRAAREFVSRTLLDWRLGRAIPFASLVASELVACSSVNAGTDIDLSVAWDQGALRLTVRDHGPALPGQPPSVFGLHQRKLIVVAGLSRAFGALPTDDGGQAVWAVLDAPRPSPSIDGRTGPSTRSTPAR